MEEKFNALPRTQPSGRKPGCITFYTVFLNRVDRGRPAAHQSNVIKNFFLLRISSYLGIAKLVRKTEEAE
jgi:hypothetical protein